MLFLYLCFFGYMKLPLRLTFPPPKKEYYFVILVFLVCLNLLRSLVASGISFSSNHSSSQVGSLYLTRYSLTFLVLNFLSLRTLVIFLVPDVSIGGITWGTLFLKGNFSASLDLYGFIKLTGM